jgi:hypothetical protein
MWIAGLTALAKPLLHKIAGFLALLLQPALQCPEGLDRGPSRPTARGPSGPRDIITGPADAPDHGGSQEYQRRPSAE